MKHKLKNILLYVAIALCLAACIFVFATDFWNIDINIIKHHELQLNDLTLKFYGDISESRIVKIYQGSIRRATVDLSVDMELFNEINLFEPYLDDLNGDGHLDLLIPHSKDSNSDLRYAAFLWDNNLSMFVAAEALNDIANVKINSQNDSVISKMFIHTVIIPEQKNAPEIYEDKSCLTEYRVVNGKFVAFREVALTYYSETNIYCYSQYDYDETKGELTYTDEQWITAKEAEKIELT